MNWKSHAIIGSATALLAAYYILGMRDVFSIVQITVFAGLSALVPDLDHDSSKGRKILDFAILLLAVLLFISYTNDLRSALLLSLSLVGLYAVIFIALKPRHRGITHSLLFATIYAITIYAMFGFNLALAGFMGYASHLLADGTVKIV